MFKSRWSKVLGIVSLTALLAGFAGCNKPSVNNPNDEESDVAAAESELGQPEQMRHGPGGPGMLLGVALHELTLSDAQKSTIKGELDALRSGADEHRGDFAAGHKALAAAVRSGKVDEAALTQKFAKEPGDPARLAKAIGVLHDTLSAAQRKELVDAVVTKMEKHGGHEGKPERGPRGDKGERGDRGDNSKRGDKGERGERGDNSKRGERGDNGERGEKGEHGFAMGHMGPMGHLLRGIDLTDSQRQAIQDAMQKNMPSEADREAMKASHEGFRKAMSERLESFVADKFDASAFAAQPAGAKMGHKGMFGGMVKMLATVTPILDETQRDALANRLENGPAGTPHAGKRHGRGE